MPALMESRMTLAIFMAVLVLSVGSAIWLLRASSSWPSTEGVVLRSEVRQVRDLFPDEDGDRRGKSKYEVFVEYEYQVDGVRHTSTTLLARLPSVLPSESEAADLVRRFPAGQSVTVHYNPRNPDDACLISGSAINTAGYIALVLVALAAIAIIVIGVIALQRNAG